MGDESDEVSLGEIALERDPGTEEASHDLLSGPVIPMTQEPTLRPAVRPSPAPVMFDSIKNKPAPASGWRWVFIASIAAFFTWQLIRF